MTQFNVIWIEISLSVNDRSLLSARSTYTRTVVMIITRTPNTNRYQTNGKKSLVWTYRSKKPILARPVTQETAIPIIKSAVIAEGSEITPGNLTRAAPKMMGVDSKNENLAAPSLVKPISSPVVIVIPERETPGMIASAWDTPISRLVPKVILFIAVFLELRRSAQYRKMPININIVAMRIGDLNTVSAVSSNRYPLNAPGTVATTRYQNNRPFTL